jgi:hypothetical protein
VFLSCEQHSEKAATVETQDAQKAAILAKLKEARIGAWSAKPDKAAPTGKQHANCTSAAVGLRDGGGLNALVLSVLGSFKLVRGCSSSIHKSLVTKTLSLEGDNS